MVNKLAAELIYPNWQAADNVRAFTTTRTGGFSRGRWDSLNLGIQCGDDPQYVALNRQALEQQLPSSPHWLTQVHGNRVLKFSNEPAELQEADAIISTGSGQVCAILHADCLTVLFCNAAGTKVAAAHAGWRGLAAGIIESTVLAMDCQPSELMAWMSPAIGPKAFEVGQEVYEVFNKKHIDNLNAFNPYKDRWLADLYELARLALLRTGVEQISGAQYCTYSEPDKFFSYRRDGITGRMASVIWLQS